MLLLLQNHLQNDLYNTNKKNKETAGIWESPRCYICNIKVDGKDFTWLAIQALLLISSLLTLIFLIYGNNGNVQPSDAQPRPPGPCVSDAFLQ